VYEALSYYMLLHAGRAVSVSLEDSIAELKKSFNRALIEL
jgi:hypothetical protein